MRLFIPLALSSLFNTKPTKLFNTNLIIHDLAGHSFIYKSSGLSILFPLFEHAWRDFSQLFLRKEFKWPSSLNHYRLSWDLACRVCILLSAEGLSHPILTKEMNFFLEKLQIFYVVSSSIIHVLIQCIFVNFKWNISVYLILLFCTMLDFSNFRVGLIKPNDN